MWILKLKLIFHPPFYSYAAKEPVALIIIMLGDKMYCFDGLQSLYPIFTYYTSLAVSVHHASVPHGAATNKCYYFLPLGMLA